ncbi:FH1/FH2 domain-containing protein 3 isoform X2 [Alosa alosa]|uniref:FH1/FH2 domain-containing protein 3 isoform X2 n=1 Tax=Alosa alosa TaxID=278164 RepID=UPI0020153703|nr:FH1/FH2 domain-containing protein 3 isoform X2 [Alosa alosa]
MATFVCRVQFLDDTDPFNSTNFPEPTRPPHYTFREDIPFINQIAGIHRLLKAPQKLDDCALQLSHNGSYLDLESTLAEQKDELEGFQEDGGRGKKHSIILRTQLSVRVHACIEKLYNSSGRELRRALFSLKQIFQDDKDLVHEFVVAEGLTCLIRVGAEADQNYQNYILRALGQIMLYVDGMNGLISHNETVQWLYTLIGSKFRLVVKTALKLLLVFVEYTEANATLLIQAVCAVDTRKGCKPWSNAMEILDEKDGVDTELLVYAMTLINKTLAGLPDQDSYYDVVDCLEEQGIEAMAHRHLNRKGTDLDLVEQFNIYELNLRHEDGDDESQPPLSGRKDRRRASVGGPPERRGLERRRSRRHSLQNGKGPASAPASPSNHGHGPNFPSFNGARIEDINEREDEEDYDEEEEEEEDVEPQVTEPSRQGTASGALPVPSAVAATEEASSLCLPFKCMVNLLPSVPETVGEPPRRSVTRVTCAAPIRSPPAPATGSPLPSPGSSLRRATVHGGGSPRASSRESDSQLPPVALPRSPHSQQDLGAARAEAGSPGGPSGEQLCSQSDVAQSKTPCAFCMSRASFGPARHHGHGTYPGRSHCVASAPSTPQSRFAPSAPPSPSTEVKTDRTTLGGLLTSSYRQHQESLAAERERRRMEREERLQRIEREERSRFNRDHIDKREEVRQAREDRYKQVERVAAEEYERERVRAPPRGRTEITLSLSSRSTASSHSPTPESVTRTHTTHVNELRSKPSRGPQAPARSGVEPLPPPPASASPSAAPPPGAPSPHSPSGADQRHSTKELAASEPHTQQIEEQQQQEEQEEEEERTQEHAAELKPGAELQPQVVEEDEKTGVEVEVEEEEAEGEMEAEDESEKEQILEREAEESSLLSEKERQNEEVNEKDNCSASSISSASSTLEREEKEEKLSSDNNSGQWSEDVDANDQCRKVLNGSRFKLDKLYGGQNQRPLDEEEKEKESERDEKQSVGQDLAIRISTLEARQQAGEENLKKMDKGHLDNQGNVRAVAEKFGDLVKGLVSPAEVEALEKQAQEKQLSDKSPSPSSPIAPPPLPKKESDQIWDQLMACPRELRIKEMNFTDLTEADDVDILDTVSAFGSSDLTPPPLPPPHCLSALPPPPPLMGCPPPPPMPGMRMPPPPPFIEPYPPPGSPMPNRGEAPHFQKKRKTIRLFWNEIRPADRQYPGLKNNRESLWSKLEPVKVDTSKLENLFETKSKELPVTKKTAADGKRQEIIVLDSKRSNAINIGLTVLPPPRTIKTAILNFDEYALNKEGIEKILTMIPTEEEKQKIQEAQLLTPEVPLGSAEQFLLTLSSITELSARLQLWAFKMDYDTIEKEVAEPMQDLKEGMEQLEKNKTLRYILSTLLAIGNFLNGSNAKGFELSYLEKVPEVKDTVHKQSLLHHACSIVVERFPDSSDLYSEIGAITRSAKVDFDQLQENLSQMERRCKASWDHLKVISKHEMKPSLKQRMSDFLKDCAERIIILKIVHRRIINRFHAFLLFLGHPAYTVRDVSVHRFSKILSEFALEYRTTRERVLQQKQKRANHRERNKTRGKMITDSDDEEDGEGGKFGGSGPEAPEVQGLGYAESAAEHESMKAVLKSSLQGSDSSTSVVPGLRTRTRANRGSLVGRNNLWSSANDDPTICTDDTADEIMERIVKSATQGPSQRAQPRERRRSRANRKSLRRTLKSGLTPEEAQALGLSSGSEMQV